LWFGSNLVFLSRLVGSPEALKIENSHMKDKNWSCPNISIWYFFWLQIARWFQKYKNYVVMLWRSTSNVTGQNDQKLAKFENFIYFDLIWPPVIEINLQTTKFLHFWNQRAICKQKKYHIDILSNFNFWPSYEIFNLRGEASGLSTNLKRKN
jgi:hypothetical protein